MKATLKDISAEIMPNFILCRYVCPDGSVIKNKYIGYKLTEAKRMFLDLINSM
jgi:hypothetical protein